MEPDPSIIRLVIADLDGTLIDREERFASETLEAILRLPEQGVMLSLASGRGAFSVLGYAARLKVRVPVIAHNGSMILSPQGEVLFENLLTAPVLRKVLGLIPPGSAIFGVFPDHVIFDVGRDERMKLLRAWGHDRYEHRPGWTASPAEAMPMLHLVGEKDEVEAIQRRLAEVPEVTPRVYPSGRTPWHHLEIRMGADDKGSALAWIMAHLGLRPEEVLAVGDWLNDIPMFERAGLSVAMPESLPEVRDRATFIAPASVRDGGVGRFLSRFLSG